MLAKSFLKPYVTDEPLFLTTSRPRCSKDLIIMASGRGFPASPTHSYQVTHLPRSTIRKSVIRAVEWLIFQKVLFGTMKNGRKSVCYQLRQFQTNWPRKEKGFLQTIPLKGTTQYGQHRQKCHSSFVYEDKVKQTFLENNIIQPRRQKMHARWF